MTIVRLTPKLSGAAPQRYRHFIHGASAQTHVRQHQQVTILAIRSARIFERMHYDTTKFERTARRSEDIENWRPLCLW